MSSHLLPYHAAAQTLEGEQMVYGNPGTRVPVSAGARVTGSGSGSTPPPPDQVPGSKFRGRDATPDTNSRTRYISTLCLIYSTVCIPPGRPSVPPKSEPDVALTFFFVQISKFPNFQIFPIPTFYFFKTFSPLFAGSPWRYIWTFGNLKQNKKMSRALDQPLREIISGRISAF